MAWRWEPNVVYCGAIERNCMEKENIIRIIRRAAKFRAYGEVSRFLIEYSYRGVRKLWSYIEAEELYAKFNESVEAGHKHVEQKHSSKEKVQREDLAQLHQKSVQWVEPGVLLYQVATSETAV